MRLSSALAAGLAGLMTLPAFAAGPVGLDAVTQWLRGVVGGQTDANGAEPLSPTDAPAAASRSAGTPPSSSTSPDALRTSSPRHPSPVDMVPLADTGDFDAAMGIEPADAITGTTPPRPLPPGLRGALPNGVGQDGAGLARPVAPAGPQRRLGDDPQAEELPQPPVYRFGGFAVRPQLDIGLGRTSNMESRAGGRSGTLYRLRSEATIASDWSRHALEATLRAGYDGYPSATGLNTPTYDGSARLRLDLMEEMRADLALRLNAARGKASSAENPAGTVVPSTTTTSGVSLGVTREAGMIGLTLRGDVDRTTYSGGELAGGGAITTDAARDNTRVAVALRASLTDAAMLRPFVEVQGLRRGFDAGSMSGRDSRGVAGLVGARLDFGPLLSGEVAAGWTREMLADASLPDLAGAIFDASVLWAPTRLTQVAFSARTTLDPTTLAGSPGSVGRKAGITVTHALRRDVIGTVGASGERRRYEGLTLEEQTLTAEAELAYRFDPHIEIYGRGEWSRFSTTAPGGDYDSVVVMTGLRLR